MGPSFVEKGKEKCSYLFLIFRRIWKGLNSKYNPETQNPDLLVDEIRCVQAKIIVTLFQFVLIYLSLTLGKQAENTLAGLLPLQLLLIAKGHYILHSSCKNCHSFSKGIPTTIN